MVGKIDIKDYVEHKDGSATFTFECDDEAKKALINEGLMSLLEKAVSEHHPEYKATEGVTENDMETA
jgi:hypothetical protein